MPSLDALGWGADFAASFEQHHNENMCPARVAVQHRGEYVVMTDAGELRAQVTGRLAHAADGVGDLPAVGDWVVVAPDPGGVSTIHAILPRRTKFSRKVAWSETEEQVLAANIDTIFIVSALTGDLNPRRLERYLILAWESGATPVIVLTKVDLCENLADALELIGPVAIGVPIHPVSSVTGEGLSDLDSYLQPAQTVALLGSSGVGKSTLINYLAGEELLRTNEIRSDGRGRHTTTHRELILLPGGALVLDTPGMRELQLWEGGEGMLDAFEDVEALAADCRFNDCAHETEPGCAVQAAIAAGSLDRERLESQRRLSRELEHLARKQDARARAEYGKQIRAQAKERRNVVW